ncbi:MAG: FKBP-type peptidyl-prolyl cis-trans isomerase [Paludibacteraceae bacterium]|nr:FKBP-type peptidyl-prolyl cis-trans isomerase [Paludibacteraceae bacterium]
MKKSILLGSVILAGLALTSCQGGSDVIAPTSIKLANETDSVSYGLGMSVGADLARNLKTFPGNLNKDAFISGLYLALNNDSSEYKLEPTEVQEMLQTYFQRASEEERMKAQLKNEEYLSANKKNEGVIVTASGLQYKVLTEGTGAKPTVDDVVKVHYTGKLTDGTVFDSSVQRGEAAQFPVGQVIPGWTEGLQLMSVGSKYEFTIPSNLAYGERPTGPIPANSILIFEVELLDIVKK